MNKLCHSTKRKSLCQPWQVNTMRLLICLAPMALWRKKKAISTSYYYFDRKGVSWKNQAQEHIAPKDTSAVPVSYGCQTLF